ncbi:MAG: HAD-IIB family hydrolase, partial [Candidatus Eremiobacteraeota bacterium]|nr:HAD-IIB family hydrolase [Candidatus Eremiobacteraeota bacterium]
DRCAEHLIALRALLGDRAYLTRSHVDFVEVVDPAVNKGEALAFVAQRHGVALDETLAVGDAWNDVPLLDAAAVGVAMGSAPPELRAHADHVVADVAHDGVAEAIERYVL